MIFFGVDDSFWMMTHFSFLKTSQPLFNLLSTFYLFFLFLLASFFACRTRQPIRSVRQ